MRCRGPTPRHARTRASRYGKNRAGRAGSRFTECRSKTSVLSGFPEALFDVSVDPIVKLVRECGGEVGPSVSRQVEHSD